MRSSFLLCLASLLTLLSMQAMAGNTDQKIEGFISWLSLGDPLGSSPPPASITFNNQYAWAHSHGRLIYLRPKQKYIGVGTFRLALSAQQKKALREMVNSLNPYNGTNCQAFESNHISFSATIGKAKIDGCYSGSLPGKQSANTGAAWEIYKKAILHGEPVVSFYPSVKVRHDESRLFVYLTIKNTGEKSITLSGPENYNGLDSKKPNNQYVNVFFRRTKKPTGARLVPSMYIGPEKYKKVITLAPQEKVTLPFKLNLEKFTVPNGLTDIKLQHISNGYYKYAGVIKVELRTKKEDLGIVRSYIEPETEFVYLPDFTRK